MAVNKLLVQRSNNSSELLEQLDSSVSQLHETFEEANRRIEREHARWRRDLSIRLDGAVYPTSYDRYMTYREAEHEWEHRNMLSPKNRMMQEERARQRAINEIEQEIKDIRDADERSWCRRLLRL